MRGKLVALFVAVAALVLAAGAPRADAATTRRHTVNRTAKLPKANAPEYSINWSGYGVPAKGGEQISAVSGSWIVPLIRDAPPGYSSSWIGIGGYASQDLIQTGTASSGHLDGNYAWYEVLPEYETRISGCAGDARCTVKQGDRVSASVVNTGGDGWLISMTNAGKWSWARAVSYHSSLSSAEWVFEAPTIGAPFGVPVGVQSTPAAAPHAKFLAGASYRVNGVNRWLAGAGPSRMIMVADPLALYRTATPSWLAGDGHFTVCAYKRTCPNF